MGDVMKLGHDFGVFPLPPVEEHTTYVEAGALTFGVEYRILTDEIIDSASGVELMPDRPTGFASQGTSIHVCSTADRGEYLRFDVFDGDPHYHYMIPDTSNLVVVFDEAAFGDMWGWVVDALQTRLPAMLNYAGATELAAVVDSSAVAAVIPTIVELATAGRKQHAAAL